MGGSPSGIYIESNSGKQMYVEPVQLTGKKKLPPMSEQERNALRPIIQAVIAQCAYNSNIRMERLCIRFYRNRPE